MSLAIIMSLKRNDFQGAYKAQYTLNDSAMSKPVIQRVRQLLAMIWRQLLQGL
jgi:hypothetical protein